MLKDLITKVKGKFNKKIEKKEITAKDIATKRGEPWVTVLDTKVNIENPRNGFFELDWNEHFIVMLKNNGYDGKTDEEIVDQWFKDLCRNILAEEGLDTARGAGYINVIPINKDQSEVS